MSDFSGFVQLIHDYGFIIIFSAIMLFIIYRVTNSVMAIYKKRQDAKLEMEIKTHESQLASDNENRRLIMDVQSKQVESLNAILRTQEALHIRLISNETILRDMVAGLDKQTAGIDKIWQRYDELHAEIKTISGDTNSIESKIDLIIQILKLSDPERVSSVIQFMKSEPHSIPV